MNRKFFLLLLFLLVVAACGKFDDYNLDVPSYGDYSLSDETTMLSNEAKFAMEGIYRVTRGSDILGDQVVLKWTTDKILSLFGEKKSVYAVLSGGYLGDLILFEGYWRRAVNEDTGLIRFFIKNDNGGADIMNNVSDASIRILGACFEDSESRDVELERVETFSDALRRSDFLILAHRAGGRTADKLPVSENSCEMVKYTERLGSTGIEIDVQLTKDGVPVVYHDDDINIRLTQKGPVMGPLSSYTYQQLNTLVRLYHGERIPTLEQLLDTVLYRTNIRLVWLDNKKADALKAIAPIQLRYMALAAEAEKQGRAKLEIVLGLPDNARVNAYLALPDHPSIPSLCEISVEDTEKANAKIYAPRWTMGIQTDAVEQLHSQGRRCFVWTLDDSQFMSDFVGQGNFDGILTNYPALLAYYHYVYHNN